MQHPFFSRTLLLLGLISLLTDMASEMLYPVMPLYLEQIGFSVLGIGLLEGVAQAVTGLSKGYFGKWSDHSLRRAPFVQWGYGISAVAKPLLAVWTAPLWVLAMRTLDRLGKGVRTGARDALLSQLGTKETRARVFGFHRSMDTLGAAVGPALALWFLWLYPGAYRTLFLLAFFPGVLAIVATLFLRDSPNGERTPKDRPGFLAFLRYIPGSQPAYRRLLWGLLAFALVNSSDFFLLLLMKEKGINDSWLIGLYIYYNLVYALAAYPAGSLADRFGLKKTFLTGIGIFAVVYGGMAMAGNQWQFTGLLTLYGLYAAGTEGIAKAWISNLADRKEVGTAIGAYEGLRSVAALLASSLAGLVWVGFGPQVLFGVTAGGAALIFVYFWRGV